MKTTTSEIKQKMKSFRREFQITEITYRILWQVFEKQGFTIIEFNPVCNDPDVSTIIQTLGLEENASHSKGFLYMDSNYRLVFINEKLNENEKMLVLAHEEGHFYCGHTSAPAVVGRDVQEEFEANEFVHYLLKKTFSNKLKEFVSKNKKQLLIGVLAIIVAGGGAFAAKKYYDRKLYEGTYYVTDQGEKYHLKNCMTIKDHKVRRLTKKDVESGEYEPCGVCMPEKK